MILVVGLGNPGKKFEKTRHNVGFRAVDGFQEKNNFPVFKLSKKYLAEISEGALGDAKVILAKPQTFMNNSGRAVKLLTRNYKLKAKSLFIVHDDIDLPFGKIRISAGRSAASHKGVESIIKELKTPHQTLRVGTGQAKNFVRFRIGIQPKTGKPENISEFVLQKFDREEEKTLKEVIKKAIEAIETAIKEGVEKAMMKFN